MKTTIELPDSLLRRAKKHAAENRVPLRAVIEDGLRKLLDEPNKRPFRLKTFGFRGEGVASGMGWPAIRELIYEGCGGAPHVDRD